MFSGMAERRRTLGVAVRAGDPRRAREVLRWVRWLLPAAILLVGPAPSPEVDEVITIDADAVQSGPLSVADALVRGHDRR